MGTKGRPGQALMELAIGMLALAMVVHALCGFALYIARSLRMQNDLRVGAASQTDKVETGAFAEEYVFGKQTLNIREEVVMPPRSILR